MIKLGGKICDRCRKIVRGGLFVKTKKKGVKLDFCGEWCGLLFFKGRKVVRNNRGTKMLRLVKNDEQIQPDRENHLVKELKDNLARLQSLQSELKNMLDELEKVVQ